jgi:hypothetical protein
MLRPDFFENLLPDGPNRRPDASKASHSHWHEAAPHSEVDALQSMKG